MIFTTLTEGGLVEFSGCGNYMCATRTDESGRHYTQAWHLAKPIARELGTFSSPEEAHNACELDEAREE